MHGSFTFSFEVEDGREILTTVTYSNPFVNELPMPDEGRRYIFEMCALSYMTGRLDGEGVEYSNLKTVSIEIV